MLILSAMIESVLNCLINQLMTRLVSLLLAVNSHRRIARGAWGCCSTSKLSEKWEIFRLSEILGYLSEIFITYLYKNALFIVAKMFLLFFHST